MPEDNDEIIISKQSLRYALIALLFILLVLTLIKFSKDRDANKTEVKASLGCSVCTVTGEISDTYDLPKGVCIITIDEDSPLAYKDLSLNTIIVEFDDTQISDTEQLKDLLTEHIPGDKCKVGLYTKVNDVYQYKQYDIILGSCVE